MIPRRIWGYITVDLKASYVCGLISSGSYDQGILDLLRNHQLFEKGCVNG